MTRMVKRVIIHEEKIQEEKAMGKKKSERKPMKKKTKIILIVVAVLFVLGLIMPESEKTAVDTQDTSAGSTEMAMETKDTATEAAETAMTETVSQEVQVAPEKQESNGTQEATGNPLLDAELMVEDVMNGSRTEKIGEYAYVTVSRETMKALTMEQYADFCENVVSGSGYNWVTIDFGDGYGIQFQGSIPQVATYGSLDTDRCISEQEAIIMQTDEGYEFIGN